MKILSIRIKNLASLEGTTEIDFTREPLSSAGIFAITGPTGAGKSTILDALCLALYSKTPRYLQAREAGVELTDIPGTSISQGDIRGILRDGTGEGFAEVDFLAINGQRYKATWQVRRARDKADKPLQAFTVTLKNIDTNTDIPGRKTELQDEIERLVGLNFEQFTRSVLLAQGDFTAFLKAAKEEKSALLEKLTGTHIYSEISKQIFANWRKEERDLENLNLQREGILTLTSEELEAFELQKATLDLSIAIQEKEAGLLSAEITWHKQLELLQSSIEAAHIAQEQANEDKQHATGRAQELKLVEQVQPTGTWIDSEQIVTTQLVEKTLTLQQLQTNQDALQQQNDELEVQLKTSNDDLREKIKNQEEAIPLLEEAKGLDIQIREKAAQVSQAATELKDIKEHSQKQGQQLQAQQLQADQLAGSIKSLEQWKENNSSRQPIAENQGLIGSKLSDAGKLLDTLQSLSPQLEATQNAIDRTQQAKINLEKISATVTGTLQAERARHKTAYEAVAAIPVTMIEAEKAAIDVFIEDMIRAEAHWKILFNNQAALDALKQKLDRNKNELGTKTLSLAQTLEQLGVLTAVRDVSLRMLHKARLAAAENVTYLRSQLTAADPCPVCGSMEHPYATRDPQLNHVLQQLETEHEQHEKAYTACFAKESNLRETGNHLKDTIAAQEQEAGTKEHALAADKETWTTFTIYPNAGKLPDEEKSGWLAQQLLGARAQQKDMQNQLKAYSVKKQELETLQVKVLDLDKQLNENTNALKDTERSLRSLQEQWAQYHKEQLQQNDALTAIEQSLAAYFSAEDWFGHWKTHPATFLDRINDFAGTWKASIQKLGENIQQLDVLSATLTATQEQLQGISTEVQKKQKAFAGLQEEQDKLTQKRKAIFNGEAAATVEAQLRLAITASQDIVEKSKIAWDQLQKDLTRTAMQKEQVEKDRVWLQGQAASFAKKIQDWLTEFNARTGLALNTKKLVALLALSPEWIEAERVALRAIDDAIMQAVSVLKERTTQLQQHEQQRLSERSAETLDELLSIAKANIQQEVQQKNEVGFRLQQDIANKQKIGDLLGMIDSKSQVVENWGKLNEIIGSADGKKFRQIAQEYTLDVLLSYANVHLGMLSSRYLLQRIPNTLGLQVLDQDMGDEVRTVYSLSGGESFLVSLALALGLASLSSSRMQVESLFIDEGFGSLDPVTLNIAMDALERLHNQGRKVGVISHVQEMTERIPVQIKVSKRSSGKSVVEVVGG